MTVRVRVVRVGMPQLNGWTFAKLTATEPTGGDPPGAKPAANQWPLWAKIVLGLAGVSVVTGLSVGVALSAGGVDTADPELEDATLYMPGGPPPPPVPPVQPPYNADEAEDYCNNDCLGCAANGGCTYSYGADGDPNTQHDSRYFQSNGVCDDGGPGSEHSYCNYGSDCADCGIRPMPPPPPDYPSMPPGL